MYVVCMKTETSVTECVCGGCPMSRRERGLACFATMTTKVEPIVEKTYEQLKAENPGCAVIQTRSGMGHGPARWTVVRRGRR